MSILYRYVLREFLVPLFYCITGFVGIYVMFEMFGSFNRLMESKLPIGDIAAYFAGYLSPFFQWLLPAALMLATLYTMWNFCRHSEITAMRASGVGFAAIVAPLITVATVFTLAVFASNEWYAPDAAENASDLRSSRFKVTDVKIARNIPYYNRYDRRIWRVDRMDTRRPNTLYGVKVTIDRPNGTREVDITCARADYLDGVWWFSYPKYRYFDENNDQIADPSPSSSALVLRQFPEFSEKPRDFVLMNKAWEFYNISDMLQYLREHPTLDANGRTERVYDFHAKIAAPFACIIITLLAIPFGVATGRQSVFNGVMSAVGLFFGYYGAVIGGMVLAKNGFVNPVIAAWVPNILFLGIGIWLFRRQR